MFFLAEFADLGCLSRILIFTHPGSGISDPGSRIQKTATKVRGEKNMLLYLISSHKFHKIGNYFIFEMLKKFSQIFKDLLNFYPTNCL